MEVFSVIARQFYKHSLESQVAEIYFDLLQVQWIDFLPAVLLLIWSSRLRTYGKAVGWVLPGKSIWSERKNSDMVDLLRFNLGEKEFGLLDRRIQGLMQKKYGSHKRRLIDISSIGEEYLNAYPQYKDIISGYIALVEKLAQGLRFVAFLERWDFLMWAERIGVSAPVDDRALGAFKYSRTDRLTGAYPLKCLVLQEEVMDTVESLVDEKTLVQIFANYSTLGLFASGAFAKILVNEMGTNIIEHAIHPKKPTVKSEILTDVGKFGFITTQILTSSKANHRSQATIAPFFFSQIASKNLDLLEIIIADDGPGIYRDLEPWMREHDSDGTRFSCGLIETGHLVERDVLAHSFDRLVSSKRDFHRLIHCFTEDTEDQERISSGLYWVWQTVKTYRGLLVLRSDSTTIWYDFTDPELVAQGNEKVDFPCCGVQIVVYLPLVQIRERPSAYFINKKMTHMPQQKTEVAWLGHVRLGNLTLSMDDISRILGMLKDKYFSLGRCRLFAIDLSGIHAKWLSKDLVSLLAHFFVELNYRSGTHQSVVVLWNVPSRWEHIIRPKLSEEVTRVVNRFPDLAALRPACLLIWDDERIEIAPTNPAQNGSPLSEKIQVEVDIMGQLLRFLASEGQMEVSDIWINLRSATRESCRRLFVSETHSGTEEATIEASDQEIQSRILLPLIDRNSHLFSLDGNTCRMYDIQGAIESRTQQQIQQDVTLSIDREIGKGRDEHAIGVLRAGNQRREWYLLPSGAYSQYFYQFGVMLSDSEWLSRIAWWFGKQIRDYYESIATTEGTLFPDHVFVISVTRSTIQLLGEIVKHLSISRQFRNHGTTISELGALTLEEMTLLLSQIRPNDSKISDVVIVTDVVSRGELVRSLCEACPRQYGVNPACVVALLDTRTKTEAEDRPINVDRFYAMLTKPTPKLVRRSDLPRNAKIVAIDRINVCPVDPNSTKLKFPTQPKTKNDDAISHFFSQLDLEEGPANKPVCRIGHFTAKNYHHYTFYPDPVTLLNTGRSSDDFKRLIDATCDYVARDFDHFCGFRQNKRPVDDIVAIYPDPEASKGGSIVREVQARIGFTQSLVLYRDREVGTWLFTPFIEHGVEMKNKYVLVIDDGCCSGQTLMAMIECAMHNKACKIAAYFVLNRMSLMSTNYFQHSFSNSKKIRIQFLFPFHIPVFDPQGCPICRYIADLERVKSEFPLPVLTEYCSEMEQKLRAIEVTSENASQSSSSSPWPKPKVSSTARLRQALEISSLVASENTFLRNALDQLLAPQLAFDDDHMRHLSIQVAYLVVTEPDVLRNRELGASPNCRRVFSRLMEFAEGEIDESTALLFIEAGTTILNHLAEKNQLQLDTLDSDVSKLWGIASRLCGGPTLISFLVAKDSTKLAGKSHNQKLQLWQALFHSGLKHYHDIFKDEEKLLSAKDFELLVFRQLLLFSIGHSRQSLDTEEGKKIFYEVFCKFRWQFIGHGRSPLFEAIRTIEEELSERGERHLDRLKQSAETVLRGLKTTEVLAFVRLLIDRTEQVVKSYPLSDSLLTRIAELEALFQKLYLFENGSTSANLGEIVKWADIRTAWEFIEKRLHELAQYFSPDIADKLKKYNQDRQAFRHPDLTGYNIHLHPIQNVGTMQEMHVFCPDDLIAVFIRETLHNLKHAFNGREKDTNNQAWVELNLLEYGRVALRARDNGIGFRQETERQREPHILASIHKVAQDFGGSLVGPTPHEMGGCETTLTLRVCERWVQV